MKETLFVHQFLTILVLNAPQPAILFIKLEQLELSASLQHSAGSIYHPDVCSQGNLREEFQTDPILQKNQIQYKTQQTFPTMSEGRLHLSTTRLCAAFIFRPKFLEELRADFGLRVGR